MYKTGDFAIAIVGFSATILTKLGEFHKIRLEGFHRMEKIYSKLIVFVGFCVLDHAIFP